MNYQNFLETKKIKNQVIKTLSDLESLIQCLENQEDFYDRNDLNHELIYFLKNNKDFLNQLNDPNCTIPQNINPWQVELCLIDILSDHVNNMPWHYSDKKIKNECKKVLKELIGLFRDLTLTFLL